MHYRRSLILPLVLALAACATPAPPPPAARRPSSRRRCRPIDFPPPPQTIVMVDPFPGAAADLEPLPPSTGDLWDRIVLGYAIPDMEGPLVEKWEQWYSRPPRLRRAHRRAQPALPVSHRQRGRGARHAARDRAAADRRKRFQSERDVDEPRVGHLAVHAVDGHDVRAEADVVVRFAPRRRRGDRLGARLPAEAERRVRRLAAVARRVQLGRGQRPARDRAQPRERPADGLRRA